MAYCGPRGIPLGQFHSWSEYDQDAALAWQRFEQSKCPGCGTHDDEWWDEKRRRVEPPPFEVEGERCAVCEATEEFKQRDDVKENATGLHLVLRRTDPLDYGVDG